MQINELESENGRAYTELVFSDGTEHRMAAEHYAELVTWLRNKDASQEIAMAILAEELMGDYGCQNTTE